MSKQDTWNERYANKELVWSAGPNHLFAEEVKDITPGKALDVACGEGRNAIWLAEQGWQVDAVDFSEVGIDKARKIASKRDVNVNFVVGDISRHDFSADSYDLVAVLYVHTSPDERNRWLTAVVAAVKAGGYFIYIGHDPKNIDHGVGGPQDKSLLPSADEIATFLGGFDIEQAEVVERSVDSDPGHGGDLSGVALDTFVRARKGS